MKRRAFLAVLLALAPAAARANGAFPDTGQVLAPGGQTAIIVGTNFGLLLGDSGGGPWRWSCEHGDDLGGYRYTVAADGRRLVAISGRALVVSDDSGCSWRAVARSVETIPFDYFGDVTDANFALALTETLETRVQRVIRLDLRTATGTPQPLYTAPLDEELTTVEMARSDPRVIYATLTPATASARTRIVRTDDGGQTWTVVEPQGAPDNVDFRIAAVDPDDAKVLYLRASTASGQGEALLVSPDGGQTVRSAFATTGSLAAFLRLQNGDALLAANEKLTGRLLRSTDHAASFAPLAATLHVRGLAERDGVVYAATDNATDKMALAVSKDRGDSWQRVMGFADVSSISVCGDLPGACAGTCRQLTSLGTLPAALCAVLPADAGPPGDAAQPADGAASDGPTSDAAGAAAPDAAADQATPDAAAPTTAGGCACAIDHGPAPAAPLLLLAIVLALRQRRRRASR